jgi:hypothetical protein
MGAMLEDTTVEPVVRMLLGATDVDGGTTEEQRLVLAAIVAGALGHTELDLDALEPLDPAAAAAAIPAAEHRRARELAVLLELCRHPLTEAQCARVEEYAVALGESDAGVEMARDLVRKGAEAAIADFQRYAQDVEDDLSEPSLRGKYAHIDFSEDLPPADPELAARLRTLHDLPAGTLGYEYIEHYRRNGLTLPGDDPNSPAVFVGHDMCHVIGGYAPTGPGEIALGAMQLAVTDSEAHWIGFLGNLAIHEAGFLGVHDFVPKDATLLRKGAADMVAHAMWRGEQCTGDWTTADHLGMVELPLEEVRARYGVPPLDPAHVA